MAKLQAVLVLSLLCLALPETSEYQHVNLLHHSSVTCKILCLGVRAGKGTNVCGIAQYRRERDLEMTAMHSR